MSEDIKFALLFGGGLVAFGVVVLGAVLYAGYLILGKDGEGRR